MQTPIRLRVDQWATEVSGIELASRAMRDMSGTSVGANGNAHRPNAYDPLSVSHLGDQESRLVLRRRHSLGHCQLGLDERLLVVQLGLRL